MQYLIIARDHKNGLERRLQHRQAHLDGAESLKREGKLLYGVAILENGQMSGSVMVMDFESEAELENWKATEPYLTGDVWENVEITECAVPSLFR